MKVGGTINAKETISSLELVKQINIFREAEGNRSELKHKTLLEIIRDEFEEEINGQKILPVNYKDAKGESRPMFELTLSQAKQILVRESKFVRKAMIAYIDKLESEVKMNLPKTFAEALRLAADQQEEIERQQKLLIQQKPKVEYFDALVDRGLNICFRDTAKEIGVKETEFIKFLLEHGYLYRDQKKKLKPFAEYVDSGLFVIKEYQNTNHTGNQTLVTPKGRETFRLLLTSNTEQNKQVS